MSSLLLVAPKYSFVIPSRAAAWSVLRFADSVIRLGVTMLFVCLCLDQSAINQSIFTHNSPLQRTRLVHSTHLRIARSVLRTHLYLHITHVGLVGTSPHSRAVRT